MDNFISYKPKQPASRLDPEVSPRRPITQNDGIHSELVPASSTHLDKIRFYDFKPRQPRAPSLPYVAKFKVADLVDQTQGAAGSSGDEVTPHAANEAGRKARCTSGSVLHPGSAHRSGNDGNAPCHPVTLDKNKKAEIDVDRGRMDATKNRGIMTADIQHIKQEETDDDAREVETLLKKESLALNRKIIKEETDNEGKKPGKGIVDTISKSNFRTVDEDGEGEADDVLTSLARESSDREEDELEEDGDAQYGPMFLAEARKKRLKRCFSDMMSVIDSGIWVDQGLADILHATMEQLERVGGDIRKHKRRRQHPTLSRQAFPT